MGQFSMEKSSPPGSVLSGNQHSQDTLVLASSRRRRFAASGVVGHDGAFQFVASADRNC
jgi:hypothetical protein